MGKQEITKRKRSQKDPTRFEDGTKIPVPGRAQQMGYVNRHVYREAEKEKTRKKPADKIGVNSFQMGVANIAPIPPYSVLRRRKLKYWQKAA